jgi:glycosyltransferase involved in cell wall biosynthesis
MDTRKFDGIHKKQQEIWSIMKRTYIFTIGTSNGGPGRAILKIGEGLINSGINVKFVVINADKRYKNIIPAGANYHELSANTTPMQIMELKNYIQENKIKTILSFSNKANLMSLLSVKMSNAPTRVIIRTGYTTNKEVRDSQKWTKKWVLPSLMERLYPKADHIIVELEQMKAELLKTIDAPESKIDVIYNPIPPQLNRKSKRELDHPYYNQDQYPTILGVGRLTDQKNFSSLIKSFDIVNSQRESRLVILGEGEKRQDLEELVNKLYLENRVSMPGFVDNPYKYMDKSDVFVLSSRYEGSVNVLIEALACECSIVSTDCPHGPSEILEGGKWGKLVQLNSIQKLSEAILDSIDSQQTPVEVRSNRFSLDNIVEQYVDILNRNEVCP